MFYAIGIYNVLPIDGRKIGIFRLFDLISRLVFIYRIGIVLSFLGWVLVHLQIFF